MAENYLVDELAQFVVGAQASDLTGRPRALLTRNMLDSVACAVGSLNGELIGAIREHTAQFSGDPTATLVGGGRASVDQAAFFNAVLVRYPDLLDTYLTVGGLCHPADNFGAVLAVAEHTGAGGADFLLALAVAYEVQCRFSAQVPVMARGLNHALQLAMSVAAGSAKLLGLSAEQTANAIAAAAADNVSLAGVHAEPVSHWKGISRPAPACAPCTRRCWRRAASAGPSRCSKGRTGWSNYSVSQSISTPPTGHCPASSRPI